jgi:hypothetical protein
MSSQTPKPRRVVWWWSRDSWSHGTLCSQKGLSSENSKSGIEESKVPSTCALGIANAKIAMGEIPMGSEPLDQTLIRGFLCILTH